MKRYCMVCAGLLWMLLISACQENGDTETWLKTFGGDMTNNYINACETTWDGGCICVGTTYHLGKDKYTILMMKINSDGTVAWRKNYGDIMDALATSIISSPVGGHYIVAGALDDAHAPFPRRNTLLLNIDTNGTILSQMTYALSFISAPARLCPTGDGGLMVSGITTDNYWLSVKLFMLKLDCKGAPVWEKQYSFLELSDVNSLFETPDRGYLVATSGWLSNAAGMGIVLKLDADGNIEWKKLTPTQALSAPMGADSYIVTTTDTGYFHDPFYSPSNTLIFRLDLNGDVGWAYTLEGCDGPQLILQTRDSGYLLAGTVVDDNSGTDIWLAKLSGDGMLEWQKTIGDEKSEHPGALLQTSGGTYIMAGYSKAAAEERGDVLVAKLDSTGSIPGCTLIGLGSIIPEETSVSVEDTGMVAEDHFVYASKSFLEPIDVDVQETFLCSASQN